MNQEIARKLREWRMRKGQEENLELYLILQNKIIDAIAEALPTNKEEFIAIKGLRDRKFQKYGKDILSIVAESTGRSTIDEEKFDQEKVYSVSDFLGIINSRLNDIHVSVKGEISSIDIRDSYLFFTIKDAEADNCMNCFMWAKDYDLSGVELEPGLEIIAHGAPEIYAKAGRFSFRTEAVELVGEGILKKRYDELKKKLDNEGLFDLTRKKPLPEYPQRIGLITSKNGAVIHDFQTNLSRFGYKITLFDSRVEGIMAVKDLVSAIRYFKDKSIDVLVVIRGGGSLESLQAFNNEALIREIVGYPVPVICGIGHDKDIPLFSLVADIAVSTPTAVTREIDRSWENALVKINQYETSILGKFQMILSDSSRSIEQSFSQLKYYYEKILKVFELFDQIIEKVFVNFSYALRYTNEKVTKYETSILGKFQVILLHSNHSIEQSFSELKYHYGKMLKVFESFDQIIEKVFVSFNHTLRYANEKVANIAKSLEQNNPERQLKLGYSITFFEGKIVKSVRQVKRDDILKSKLKDGEISSIINKIN